MRSSILASPEEGRRYRVAREGGVHTTRMIRRRGVHTHVSRRECSAATGSGHEHAGTIKQSDRTSDVTLKLALFRTTLRGRKQHTLALDLTHASGGRAGDRAHATARDTHTLALDLTHASGGRAAAPFLFPPPSPLLRRMLFGTSVGGCGHECKM